MSEKRVTREVKQEIVRQYHAGKSVEQISSEYAYSKSSIYRWIREFPYVRQEQDEFFDDAYTPHDLGWMYAMMGMVQDNNKIVKLENPSWLIS